MLVKAIRLRRLGLRIPADELRVEVPMVGMLSYEDQPHGQSSMICLLMPIGGSTDGHAWALASLRNVWTDKTLGEMVESCTMLTQNADAHPLMRRMHKPDPKLGPDQQDKRSVVALESDEWDTWAGGAVAGLELQHTVGLLAPMEIANRIK